MGSTRTDAGEDRLTEQLPEEALELVAFLTRSEHRLRVLDLLDGGERTREELRQGTSVTRVTLSRILGDLTDRGLVAADATGDSYERTDYGDLVYRDVVRLLGTAAVGQAYPGVVERLPTERFDFDLRCLADGTHITGEHADPVAGARAVADAAREAAECEAVVGTFTSLPMYAFEEAVAAGEEPDCTVVFDARVTETMLTDPRLREKWRQIEAANETTVYYGVDDRVPYTVDLVGGDTVFITVDRDREGGFDVIRCDHPEVVAWARRTVEEHRAAATPLAELSVDE